MVSLITEKITNIPVLAPVVSTKVTTDNVNQPEFEQQSKKNYKSLLPLSMIAGGGLLIYYGVKRPSQVKLYKAMVKDRCYQIEKSVQDFSKFASDVIDSSFDKPSQYILDYRRARNFELGKHVDSIKFLPDVKSVLKFTDASFNDIRKVYDDSLKAGATPFDSFHVILSRSVLKAKDILNAKRSEKNVLCGDLTIIPPFKDGKHSDLVEESCNALSGLAGSAYSEMKRIQSKKLHGVVASQSAEMAKVILDCRKEVFGAKSALMNESFERVKRILKLSGDFKPVYANNFNLDKFSKLTKDELKPQAFPEFLDEPFQGNIYWRTVKTRDFSELKLEDIKNIFNAASPYNTVKDIGFMIDRVRLSKEFDKSLGKNNEKVYDNAIAKLEYLSVKLNDFGHKTLLKKCSADYDGVNVLVRNSMVSYIGSLSKKLGFSSIFEMDKCFSKKYPEYNNYSIKKYMEIFKENPEFYFV